MINRDLIGAISLNSAFILYLWVFIPQILHNRKPGHLAQLSPGMHGILFASYYLDLIYGFANNLQWQYKCVSIFGLSLLMVQHLQMTRHYHAQRSKLFFYFNMTIIISTGVSLALFFLSAHATLARHTILTAGYLSRAGFLLYTLPQIIKNRALESASALSIKFIYSSLILSVLDTVSAWCLDWGWPNKLSSPVTLCLMLLLFLQARKYKPCAIQITTTLPTMSNT